MKTSHFNRFKAGRRCLEKMKEKIIKLSLLLLILFLSLPVFAESNSYKVDLDNDGKVELIKIDREYETFENSPVIISGLVTVINSDGSKVGQFKMPNHIGNVEFISLNKDNSKQIVAWSSGGAHYTNIAIYGYRDGKLYKIFKNGSACPVIADFKNDKPLIKVGRANWAQEGWCYATGEPLWQVYVWNGKEFVYDEKLSTTPEISEEEEVNRYINKIISIMEKEENK